MSDHGVTSTNWDELHAALQVIAADEAAETDIVWPVGFPPRWFTADRWRCVNGHVTDWSSRPERLVAAYCRGVGCDDRRVHITFPEDGDGPLLPSRRLDQSPTGEPKRISLEGTFDTHVDLDTFNRVVVGEPETPMERAERIGRPARLYLRGRLLISRTRQGGGAPIVDQATNFVPDPDGGADLTYPSVAIRRPRWDDRTVTIPNIDAEPVEALVIGWRSEPGRRPWLLNPARWTRPKPRGDAPPPEMSGSGPWMEFRDEMADWPRTEAEERHADDLRFVNESGFKAPGFPCDTTPIFTEAMVENAKAAYEEPTICPACMDAQIEAEDTAVRCPAHRGYAEFIGGEMKPILEWGGGFVGYRFEVCPTPWRALTPDGRHDRGWPKPPQRVEPVRVVSSGLRPSVIAASEALLGRIQRGMLDAVPEPLEGGWPLAAQIEKEITDALAAGRDPWVPATARTCPLPVIREDESDPYADRTLKLDVCGEPLDLIRESGLELHVTEEPYDMDSWWRIECRAGHVLLVADTEDRPVPEDTELIEQALARCDRIAPADPGEQGRTAPVTFEEYVRNAGGHPSQIEVARFVDEGHQTETVGTVVVMAGKGAGKTWLSERYNEWRLGQ